MKETMGFITVITLIESLMRLMKSLTPPDSGSGAL